MSITLITHHDLRRGRDIRNTVNSVNMALIPGVKHKVIDLDVDYSTFLKCRFDALYEDEYIGFVDDDDFIDANILPDICAAIEANPDKGLIYTHESNLLITGEQLIAGQDLTYDSLWNHPITPHHLSIIKTSAVTEEALKLALKYKCGIEWAIRSQAGLQHGAVCIPKVGYFYRHHEGQLGREVTQNFRKGIKPMSESLRDYMMFRGRIPNFTNGDKVEICQTS